MSEIADFYGPNAGYVLDLYDRYRQNPDSVDADTRAAFARWTPDDSPLAPSSGGTIVGAPLAAPSSPSGSPELGQGGSPSPSVDKIVGAARVARLVRELGHMTAHIDALGSEPPGDPELELSTHGLQTDDLAALPASVISGPLAVGAKNALEALGRLRRVYSGPIGYESDHIQIPAERDWLRDAAESGQFFQNFDNNEKRAVLKRLTAVEGFERYLQATFPGAKRFSIEGTDMLVPMLDSIIGDAAQAGTHEVVMGMAHRGRLNVLAHVLGKSYSAILAEFGAARPDESPSVSGTETKGFTGDVKYHLGARFFYSGHGATEMPITLAPNPSHLEFVNPVAMGRARAAQDTRDRPGPPVQNSKFSLAILIHGDAAFPGQGIVAETLNLCKIPGYSVGGTIHIITNNQIGFTTTPRDSRSTLYASDLAKGFEIPILHVNADDPAACLAAARMAFAYREQFGKDFLIDLIGYRRFGHNEGEEPAYTQPRMYEAIRSHPTVRELWAKELERQEIVTRDEAEAMVKSVREKLEQARATPSGRGLQKGQGMEGMAARASSVETAVPTERLIALNEALLARPKGFTADAKLERLSLQPRRAALLERGRISWAHAEALALASILADGVPIRLSGQDTQRGTFSQRHLVLHDPTTGEQHSPLQSLPQAKASCAVINSPLSENACVGFEYGYSMHATDALVLWEAQFGDFVNGAQVILDQFLVSGNAKWQQTPSLALLLPHGYEGSGPEHSSARLERFLQLAGNDNIRVVNCTTAAQYFHLLRRQAALLETAPCPLVVMTPKGLLKVNQPPVGSSLSEMTQGRFQAVLDDPRGRDRAARVSRLILCSGKVYVDLLAHKDYETTDQVAVVRVEELYPFPIREIEQAMSGYPHLREVIWLQEEPRNMGAWRFVSNRLQEMLPSSIKLHYVGRPEAASPAEGSMRRHNVEQTRLLSLALSAAPEFISNGETPKKEVKRKAPAHAR